MDQENLYAELDELLNCERRYIRLQDSLGFLVRRDTSQIISPREDKIFVTKVDSFSTSFTGQYETLEEAYSQATRVLNHGVLLQIAPRGTIFPEQTPLASIEKLARCTHIAVQKPPIPSGIASQLYESILQTE